MNLHRGIHTNWRLVTLRAVLLLALLIGIAGSVAVVFLPTRSDVAAEKRLLGKWGLYAATSNTMLPPERIIEFLPGGQSADYSAELERIGPTDDNLRQTHGWCIRKNTFISTLVSSGKLSGALVERAPISWLDDNMFTLTFGQPGSPQTTVIYRRIGPEEVAQIRARASNRTDPAAQ